MTGPDAATFQAFLDQLTPAIAHEISVKTEEIRAQRDRYKEERDILARYIDSRTHAFVGGLACTVEVVLSSGAQEACGQDRDHPRHWTSAYLLTPVDL